MMQHVHRSLSVCLALGALGGCAATHSVNDDRRVTFQEISVPARAAILEQAGGMEIEEIESTWHAGQQVYGVEFAGGHASMLVTRSGVVIEREREISPDALPAEVRSAIANRFPGATLLEADDIEAHYFEVEFRDASGTHEVRVSPTGAIMHDDDMDDDDDDDMDHDDDDDDMDDDDDR